MTVPAEKKHLLVEGKDEQYAIPFLLEKHGVAWGNSRADWPVHIQDKDGIENILADGVVSAHLKSAEFVGIVVDANDSFDGRWQRLRDLCVPMFPLIPETMPNTGLIIENQAGKRLGIWIMPDNTTRGMMETFMKYLVPGGVKDAIWLHAEKSVSDAKIKGAPFRPTHKEKAELYTWLAWQDEPAQSMGRALLKNILNSNVSYAVPFVNWFRALFQV